MWKITSFQIQKQNWQHLTHNIALILQGWKTFTLPSKLSTISTALVDRFLPGKLLACTVQGPPRKLTKKLISIYWMQIIKHVLNKPSWYFSAWAQLWVWFVEGAFECIPKKVFAMYSMILRSLVQFQHHHPPPVSAPLPENQLLQYIKVPWQHEQLQ